jgi:hypothetical protein
MDQNRVVENSTLGTLVSVGLGAIQGPGALLAAGWTEWDTRRRFRQVEDVIQQIQEKLAHLRVNEGTATEAGMHLLDLVLQEAQREHEAQKRQRLANVVVSTWVSEATTQTAFDEGVLFLRATAAFTESHIGVLNKLYESGPSGSVPFDELAALVSDCNDAREATLIIMNDLCASFAFAKRAWDLNRPKEGGHLFMTGNLSPEGIARKCFHAITERGMRFVRYVIQGPSTPLGS